MSVKISSAASFTPRVKAIVAALGIAFGAGPLLAAEHQLTKINFDATRNVNVLDMVMSIDWDFDNPPAGRDKAFIEGIARQASKSLFTMTEGRQMLGKLYVYKNSQFMNNTDIQYLLKDGRANAHISGITTCKVCRVQQFAGTNETPVDHGKTVAHEFGHYVLGVYDEYREAGGTSTEAGAPQDGDTPRDSIMHNHLQFTSLSTATDYVDPAVRKTAQFRVFGKSAWEILTSAPSTDTTPSNRIQFDPFKTLATPTGATLTKPTTGWENDIQIVYMGGDSTTTASQASATRATTPGGPINAIIIDTTTSAANLTAQLHAAAQIIDNSSNSNRVTVFAHPFSSAPVVPVTSLSTPAARTAVKAAIAKIASDASVADKDTGDRLMNWAETLLPAQLPAGPATVSSGGIYFRVYPTGFALGVVGGNLYYAIGSDVKLLGAVSLFLPQAKQTLNASLQVALDKLKAVRTLSDTPTITLLTTSTQTVDSSLIAAFRAANVSVNPVALNLPTLSGRAASQPRLRATTAGQTSLFDLAKGTFGSFKEASKPGDLVRSAGQVANASEGDNSETANQAEVATLAASASSSLKTRIASGGVDGQTEFKVYWSEEDAGKLSFSLTTPSGTVVTPTTLPTGITYKSDDSEGEASYTVSAGFAGLAGEWTSKVAANAATVDAIFQEVTVASSLSAGLDITGGTNADPSAMKAVVEVSGPVAVQGATVKADVINIATGATVKSGLTLLDTGVAPDVKKGDGKYSISLDDLPAGEYEIVATVTNTGGAVYTTSGNTKQGVNVAPESVPAFQRVTSETFVKER